MLLHASRRAPARALVAALVAGLLVALLVVTAGPADAGRTKSSRPTAGSS